MKDHTKLRVFTMADELVTRIYTLTSLLPSDERFGLVSQLRRASVSVATNIVEGCARAPDFHPEKDVAPRVYVHFLEMAFGSACEVQYLVGLACRLHTVHASSSSGLNIDELQKQCNELVRALARLIRFTPGDK